jgi:hypothetical protein
MRARAGHVPSTGSGHRAAEIFRAIIVDATTRLDLADHRAPAMTAIDYPGEGKDLLARPTAFSCVTAVRSRMVELSEDQVPAQGHCL